jgi:hypothetical protein
MKALPGFFWLLRGAAAAYQLRRVLALALFVLAAPPTQAASFVGTQTGPTEWTYTLTYDPLDNYAVCPAPGDVAKITLSGLSGVVSATAPTSHTEGLPPGNLDWIPQVSPGGTVVTWTHQGAGTGNFGVPMQVFGFKVSTATPVPNGTVKAASDGFSFDVSVTGPCPVEPQDDRDFTMTTNGPAADFKPVIDEFWIVKDGAEIFRDSFNDGVLPPSGPDGATTYSVVGGAGMTGESGGKLTMTPAVGEPAVITTTAADVVTGALRNLTTDPMANSLDFLGQASSFEIHALYDLSSLPVDAGQSFQVRATDRALGLGNVGDNTYLLFVGFNATNAHTVVAVRRANFVANTSTLLGGVSIEPWVGVADQIELILSKAEKSDQLTASYKLYQGGGLIFTGFLNFETPLTIYNGENYIRAQILASDRLIDSDGDGVPDGRDNSPFPNPDQADRDGDGVGDASDNCPLVANADQNPEACAEHYSEVLVVDGGTKAPGESILVTATFTNTSGADILTIRPDCVNTEFTLSYFDGETTVVLAPNIREKIYGIPNDLVTIAAGAGFSVTCNLAEMFDPEILEEAQDPALGERLLDVQATYANFIVDRDLVDGVCTLEPCYAVWVGEEKSASTQVRVKGPAVREGVAAESTPVTIDIKPGEFPNSINLGSSGVVPVAILSTPQFDATTVDPTSVELAGAKVRLKGKGSPMASLQDVNKDGRMDLVVHVSTEALELTGIDVQAFLEGRTFGGAPVIGTDSIRVVP